MLRTSTCSRCAKHATKRTTNPSVFKSRHSAINYKSQPNPEPSPPLPEKAQHSNPRMAKSALKPQENQNWSFQGQNQVQTGMPVAVVKQLLRVIKARRRIAQNPTHPGDLTPRLRVDKVTGHIYAGHIYAKRAPTGYANVNVASCTA